MRFGKFKKTFEILGIAKIGLATIGGFLILISFYNSGTELMLFMCGFCVIMWIIFSAAGFWDDAMLLSPGDSYRDSIVLDEEGVRYERVKAEDQIIPWDMVFSVRVVHVYRGSYRIEIKDCSGRQMIWLPFDKEVVAYLRREHPELSVTDRWRNPPDKRWRI